MRVGEGTVGATAIRNRDVFVSRLPVRKMQGGACVCVCGPLLLIFTHPHYVAGILEFGELSVSM
jgi:hypothetical protein